ncbi:unnamed protein product [Prunus armeniaca]
MQPCLPNGFGGIRSSVTLYGVRRNLNEVEVGELVWMLQILDRVRLSQYRGDSRRWKLDGSSGSFSGRLMLAGLFLKAVMSLRL